MSLLFSGREQVVANHEHVWIIPVALASLGGRLEVGEEVAFHALPDVVLASNVLGCAPRVGDLWSPLSHIFVTPAANREVDLLLLHCQSLTHG